MKLDDPPENSKESETAKQASNGGTAKDKKTLTALLAEKKKYRETQVSNFH
jgi:hypothetical protein